MSDGSISQDEIDALLSGGSSSSTSSPSPSKEMVVQAGFDGLAKFASGNVPSFSTKLGSATSASASISLLAVEEREGRFSKAIAGHGGCYLHRFFGYDARWTHVRSC